MRLAATDDALCIGALATQVYLDTYAPEGMRADLAREVQSLFSTAAIAAQLAKPDTRFLLAEVGGRLVGFLELALHAPCPLADAADAEIVRLYLHRNFQRHGLGRSLCDQAQALARSRLWLSAWAGNAQALAFYRATGWTDIGRIDHRIEGQAFENRVFARG